MRRRGKMRRSWWAQGRGDLQRHGPWAGALRGLRNRPEAREAGWPWWGGRGASRKSRRPERAAGPACRAGVYPERDGKALVGLSRSDIFE